MPLPATPTRCLACPRLLGQTNGRKHPWCYRCAEKRRCRLCYKLHEEPLGSRTCSECEAGLAIHHQATGVDRPPPPEVDPGRQGRLDKFARLAAAGLPFFRERSST